MKGNKTKEFDNIKFEWNVEKNITLYKERNISFEDIVNIIVEQKTFKIFEHPNKEKYPNQRIIVVNFKGYYYVVPYIRNNNFIFLKTIYPSRKLNKLLGEKND